MLARVFMPERVLRGALCILLLILFIILQSQYNPFAHQVNNLASVVSDVCLIALLLLGLANDMVRSTACASLVHCSKCRPAARRHA